MHKNINDNHKCLALLKTIEFDFKQLKMIEMIIWSQNNFQLHELSDIQIINLTRSLSESIQDLISGWIIKEIYNNGNQFSYEFL